MNEMYMELYEKLSRLQWLLQRQHLRSHAEHGPMGDPMRGQGRVLAMLKMKPEITTKELSYLLDIRQQSLNELLNKLERADYLIRTPSEADRRIMMVQLTEKGKNEHHIDMDFGGIFGCLNDEEQVTFGEYLDRIIAALEEQLRDEADAEPDERLYDNFGAEPHPYDASPPPPYGPPPPPPHGPPPYHGPPPPHPHGSPPHRPPGPPPHERHRREQDDE